MSEAAEPLEIAGEFREPRNLAQEIKGSIHDDATATKLGLRGGTVAGSVHMDQFVPLLLAHFGDGWLKTGGMSLYFKQATVDREKVRAILRPDGERARLTMQNEAGALVCEGTASLGEDPRSELRQRLEGQERSDTAGLRILRRLKLGPLGEAAKTRQEAGHTLDRVDTLTEPLPAYRGEDARWKGVVLPPQACVQLFASVHRANFDLASKAVGLFGAIEIQFLDGPLFADTDYTTRAEIVALSESPKTENLWYEVTLSDAEDQRPVARMLQYLRFMKASSPLYA